jgi:dTDP-4-dehydrorhamnose reductase
MTRQATPPRILQFGTIGQLGLELIRIADLEKIALRAVTLEEADFTKPTDVVRAVEGAGEIDAVVNATAYTAVDKAESDEKLATIINGDTVGVLARACAARGVPLIHVSTDYVYDGTKSTPYVETDATRPISAYGRSKLAGEDAIRREQPAHVIIRTSWIYSAYGSNFVKTMLRLGAERHELKIVDDQYGAPTSAADLAQAIITVARQLCASAREAHRGTFHYTGGGETTWFGFAKEIFECSRDWSGAKARMVPVAAADYPAQAKRPRNSRLDCGKISRIYGIAQVPWQTALRRTLDELRTHRKAEAP